MYGATIVDLGRKGNFYGSISEGFSTAADKHFSVLQKCGKNLLNSNYALQITYIILKIKQKKMQQNRKCSI